MRFVKWRVTFAAILLLMCAFLGAMPANAEREVAPQVSQDVAPKERHAVFAITAYAGPTYINAFCPPKTDTIYFVAGQDSVLALRETMVYYWPITKEFKADWAGLNTLVQGTLDVMAGDRLVQSVTMEDYTLKYTQIREPQGKAALLLGAEAVEGRADWEKVWQAYPEESERYQEAMAEFRRDLAEGKAGPEDEPLAPKPVDFLVSPVQSGFVLNLPAGNYSIRVRGSDGKDVPGSARKLVVFQPRRTGVGYVMIPENKWTVQEMTDDPADQLYARTDATLYLQPYRAEEFNELHYRRLVDPQSRLGSMDRWVWVHGEPLVDAALELRLRYGDGAEAKVQRKPYYVRQTGGSGLGYEVLEWSEETLPGRTPSFEAYRLSLRSQRALDFWLSDSSGQILIGSSRQMRVVSGDMVFPIVLPALVPLVFGGTLFVETRRREPKVPKRGHLEPLHARIPSPRRRG